MKPARLLLAVVVLGTAFGGSAVARATNPGENGRIVFSGLSGWIYTINPDGTGMKRVGPYSAQNSTLPYWSPDGSRIIFFSSGPYMMQADGSGVLKVPAGSAGPWSPDGTKIVYSCGGICVMAPDGSDIVQLNTNGAQPTWSPDGTRIAFIRGTGDGHFQLWTMNSNGSDETLVHDDTVVLSLPDWAPDGSAILLDRGDGGSHPHQIWSVEPDGSNPTQLTTNGQNDYQAWSPDGTKIVFASSRGGMWLMNADGSNQVRIKGKIEFSHPNWQPVSLTLSANRPEVTFGGSLKLKAHLLPYASSANHDVSIYELSAAGAKTLVASGAVNGNGNFFATVEPTKHTRYRAEWSGDATHLGGGVAETKVKVHALVTGSLRGFDRRDGGVYLYDFSARCPAAGRHCPTFHAHVAPNHAGRRVELFLEVKVKQRWREVLHLRKRLDERSSYTVRYVYGGPGIIGYPTRTRARFVGDDDHLSGHSPWLYFRVT